MPDIQVVDLCKSYRVAVKGAGVGGALRHLLRREHREVRAVQSVSFDVEPGEVVGFLGANGAGKTTTLKMLTGLIRPTSGRALVAGEVPFDRKRRFLQSITLVMGQKQQLLWDLPPSDTFLLNRAVYGVNTKEYEATLAELDELLELGDLVKKPTRQLSLGERMKCELAAALIHRPDVLFLDEPTIGLDVSMQLSVRDFIRKYNERAGATVILTSHYMDDVAALCPRVVVIDRGSLVYDGDLDGLVRKVRPEKRVVLRLSAPLDPALVARLGTVVEEDKGRLVLSVPAANVRDVVGQVLGAVVDLTVEDPPLEEVLRDLFAASKAARSEAPPRGGKGVAA
jgi:ABC-2 type transport system ATP-binding protein